jgi:hypothetical protein
MVDVVERLMDMEYYAIRKPLIIREVEKQNDISVREWTKYLLSKGFKYFIFIEDDRIAGFKYDIIVFIWDCGFNLEDCSKVISTTLKDSRIKWGYRITYLDDRKYKNYVLMPDWEVKI